MKHSAARIRVALLLACASQLIVSQGAFGQGPTLQQGSKAQVVLRDRSVLPFEGRVTETWDDGFTIDINGQSRPQRVYFAEVESLQRSLRLGSKVGEGAKYGGAIMGGAGFLLGYCFQLFSDQCAEDVEAGIIAGLAAGAAGALVGAGIGALMGRYGPWEAVTNLGGPDRSGDSDRLSVDLLPYPDGRIGLGVSLNVGGGL
jgi:hypothetical protein